MKIDSSTIDFFLSIPDDVLAKIAFHDMEALEQICMALTLDIQLLKESANTKDTSYKI